MNICRPTYNWRTAKSFGQKITPYNRSKRKSGKCILRDWFFKQPCGLCDKNQITTSIFEYGVPTKTPVKRHFFSSGVCLDCEKKIIKKDNFKKHPYQHPLIKQFRLNHRQKMKEWCKLDYGTSQGEQQLRKVVNLIFPNSKKVYNSYIVNRQGKRFELDIFLPEEKIAFEYNGEQHYKFIKWLQQKPKHFKQLVKRDREKRKLCVQKSISLITIRHNQTFTESIIKGMIRQKIRKGVD